MPFADFFFHSFSRSSLSFVCGNIFFHILSTRTLCTYKTIRCGCCDDPLTRFLFLYPAHFITVKCSRIILMVFVRWFSHTYKPKKSYLLWPQLKNTYSWLSKPANQSASQLRMLFSRLAKRPASKRKRERERLKIKTIPLVPFCSVCFSFIFQSAKRETKKDTFGKSGQQ